jgi:hypothetical protein
MVFGPLRRVKFLITAPFIVLMLFVINVMTSPANGGCSGPRSASASRG